MNQEQEFYTYLSEFQEDIKKLINFKKRRDSKMSQGSDEKRSPSIIHPQKKTFE